MASKQTQRTRELELHRAIGGGDVEATSRLLSDSVDPDCIGGSSRNFKYAFTALCAAIQAVKHTDSQPKIANVQSILLEKRKQIHDLLRLQRFEQAFRHQ